MFGQQSTTFGGSAFGQPSAFGTNSNTTNSGSLFGGTAGFQANQPTQSTSNFFGQNNNSAFGNQANLNTGNTSFGSAFSSSQPQSAFGAKPMNAFGSATSAFGSSAGNTASTLTGNLNQQNGTGQVPFSATAEQDPTKIGVTNYLQSITAQPVYSNFSFEELRLQDYAQGRKMNTSDFQQPNTFGQPAASGVLGGQQTSAFGAATNTSSPFGGNTNTGLFGNTGNQTNSTAFGSPFGSNSNTGGNTLFGQNQTNSAGFGFNSSTPQNNNTGTGLFGQSGLSGSPFGQVQNRTQPSTTFGFGSNNTNLNTNSGNQFGSSSFGSKIAAAGTFGMANSNNNVNNSGSLFGQTQSSNIAPFGQSSLQPNTGNSIFGQTNPQQQNSLFGSKPATSFGQPQMTTGGLFGNSSVNNNQGGSIFGNSQKPAGSSLFGNNSTSTNSGFAFGGPNTAATTQNGLTASTSSSGFGNQVTGTGLFGNTQQTQNNAASNFGGNLFGNKPQGTENTGFSFGSNTANTSSNAPNQSLFNKPAFGTTGNGTTGTSLFGNNANVNPNTQSGSLFGSTTTNSSLSQGGTFTMLGNGTSQFGKPGTAANSGGLFNSSSNTLGGLPTSTNSSLTSQNGGLFSNRTTTGLSFGGQGLNFSGANSGANTSNTGNTGNSMVGSGLFGQQQQSQQQNQPIIATVNNCQNPYGTYPLFNTPSATTTNTNVGAVAIPLSVKSKEYTSLSAFNLGPRRIKRVQKITTSHSSTSGINQHNETKSGQFQPADPLFSARTDDIILMSESFDPHSHSRRHRNEDEQLSILDVPNSSVLSDFGRTPTRALVSSSKLQAQALSTPTKNTETPDSDIVDSEGYWISPSQAKLSNMSLRELRAVHHFRVGRKGYGIAEFDAPIDLSEFSDAHKQIPGRIVVFDKATFTLYPDDAVRPTIGRGLCQPVTVTLFNVWAHTRDTQQPIKDPTHPFYEKHLRRLKGVRNTKFISWQPETGSWMFQYELPKEEAESVDPK